MEKWHHDLNDISSILFQISDESLNWIEDSYPSLTVIAYVFKPSLLLRILSHDVNQIDSLRKLEMGEGRIYIMFGKREEGTANFEKNACCFIFFPVCTVFFPFLEHFAEG